MEDNQAYITSIVPDQYRFTGLIKQTPEQFKVTEVPLYECSGAGQHVFITLTRKELNTHDVIQQLAKKLSIPKSKIGCAGKKDKSAITTQTFSIDLGANSNLAEIKNSIEEYLPHLTIESISRHHNKLKTGHLTGNNFEIIVLTEDRDAIEKTSTIIKILTSSGIPNFYGTQRFGSKGDNQIRGKELLLNPVNDGKHHKNKFLLSSYQSHLFNLWLSARIIDKLFDQKITGDLYDKQEIYTGPMFGSKMLRPDLEAKKREESILKTEELNLENFANLIGSRRPAKFCPKNLEVTPLTSNSLLFSFFLPKGSYATVLLDQFVRKD